MRQDPLKSPCPYRVIEDFLGDAMVGRLLAFAQDNRAAFHAASIGSDDARIDPAIRKGERFAGALGPLGEELAERLRGVMDWAVDDLRLSPFDLARQEMELVAHGDGAFYKRHIDTEAPPAAPKPAADRVLTGVYYFHRRPKGFSGGALRMYAVIPVRDGGGFVDLEPRRDSLVLFPSWAPHEVLPVTCPSGDFADYRFAVNCWFRRRPVP